MTSNLEVDIINGVEIQASKIDGTTFQFKPTSCGTQGACALDGITIRGSSGYATGWYYNWFATTAGTKLSNPKAGDTVPGSICPKNWILPFNYTINSAKSYGGLTNSYNLTENGQPNRSADIVAVITSFPLDLQRTFGTRRSGTFVCTGECALYHSNGYSGAGTGYQLYLDALTIDPQHGNGLVGEARKARCVAL